MKLRKKRILLPSLALIILLTTASYKSDFFEIAKQIEIFTTVFKEINMNYVDEIHPAELMNTAITAMLQDLDPYTHYWNEQEVAQGRIRNSGDYTGIGADVKSRDDKITIMESFKDSPADKAGLKAGDEIIRIGEVTVSQFKNDAGELLKGAPGTSIAITFLRQGVKKNTALKRERTATKAVVFSKLIAGDIGYIVLKKFNRKASSETQSALKKLKEEGAKRIILDLRDNPGGLLSEAINTANLFLAKGETIVTTKSVIEKYNKTYKTKHPPMDTDIPLAVLVNGHSASASEIVSGSLQDLDRAVIIGARSFGKGLVQRPKALNYGTQFKITISRYYTPSGRCIQALDYWHRDKNGRAVRKKRQDYQAFTTRNGRKVYDGGGIMPDIKIETSSLSGITQALLKKGAIFDFATQYYYQHKVDSPTDFKFNKSDYADFKKFLKKIDWSYQTDTEKGLQKTLREAKEEGYQKDIQSEYNALLARIDQVKQADLDKKQPEIERLLIDEIIKRYFYQEGLYTYAVEKNPDIQAAKKVLHDPKQYQEILK